MRQKCKVSVAGIAGILLLFSNSAQANEADDTIFRLTAQAREQVKAGNLEELRRTIGEITKALPDASPEGTSAAAELDRYLVSPGDAEQTQGAPTTAAPDSIGTPTQPPQQPPLPLPAVAAPLSPPALLPAPVSSTILPASADPPKPLDVRLVSLLRRHGDTALGVGDISGARRFYQRGAEAGCGACAEALARTYDAEQLRRMGAVGIKPDPAQAEAWRTRARTLGWTGAP